MSEPLLLTYDLRPFPGLVDPDGHPATGDLLGRLQAILQVVTDAGWEVGDPDPDADFQDFWEDAIRISSILTAAEAAGRSWKREDALQIWSAGELSRRLGPVWDTEGLSHNSDPLLDHELMTDPALTRREIYPATWSDSHEIAAGATVPTDDAVSRLLELHRAGHTRAVVKVNGHKLGVTLIELCGDREELAHRLLVSDLGWTLIRHEGLPDSLRISPWVPMTYEYRVFVVDGVPVTGAGCIEEFTPLDHESADEPFDPWVRRLRGNDVAAEHDSTPLRRPEVARRAVDRARELAARLPAGRNTVVMDFALIDEGPPVLIELNALPNSGLYAIDADALARALVDALDHGYWAQLAAETVPTGATPITSLT